MTIFPKLSIFLIFVIITIQFNLHAQSYNLDFNNDLKQKLIRNQFVKYKTGQASYYFGGFGTYSLADNLAALNFNKITKESNIWNLNIAGGASDGFLSIFKNKNFSSNVKLGLSFNVLLDDEPKVAVTSDFYRAYNTKENELEYQYKLEELNYENNIKKLILKAAKAKDSLKVLIDSIDYQLVKSEFKDSLEIVANYLKTQRELLPRPNEIVAKNSRATIKKDINDVEPQIVDFNMHWITFDVNGGKK